MQKHSKHLQRQTKQKARWTGLLTLQTIFLMSISSTTLVAAPIPEETGASGHLNLGVMALKYKSNFLAEVISIDLSDSTITSLDKEANNKNFFVPANNYLLSYTWAAPRTQVYFGNQVDDFLRGEISIKIGMRKEFGGAGTFGLEALTNAVDIKVWKDPYVVNAKRVDTSKSSRGARIIWDQILGSAAEIRFSSQKLELDNERSGTAFGLNTADRELLNREGDVNRVEIQYSFPFRKGHLLVPRLNFIDYDLDGKAVASDGAIAELSYTFPVGPFRYITDVSFGKFKYDVVNPIYGVKDEATVFNFSATLAWPNIFGLENWVGNTSFNYYTKDHDIDFYSTQAIGVRIAMLYRF